MEPDPTPVIFDASGNPYGDAVAIHRPAGAILVDGRQVADTLQCVHCGGHWVPQKGSGRVRGWCTRCQGPVCGLSCARCLPLEKALDLMDQPRSVLDHGRG